MPKQRCRHPEKMRMSPGHAYEWCKACGALGRIQGLGRGIEWFWPLNSGKEKDDGTVR